MALDRRQAGANIPVVDVRRRASGSWVLCAAVYRRLTSAWIKVWPEVKLSARSASSASSTAASCVVQLTSGGILQVSIGSVLTNIADEWLQAGSAGNYEVFATLVTGTTPTGTFGSWLNLGTARTWTLTRSTPVGTSTCSINLQIRRAGTTTVLANANFSMSAQRT